TRGGGRRHCVIVDKELSEVNVVRPATQRDVVGAAVAKESAPSNSVLEEVTSGEAGPGVCPIDGDFGYRSQRALQQTLSSVCCDGVTNLGTEGVTDEAVRARHREGSITVIIYGRGVRYSHLKRVVIARVVNEEGARRRVEGRAAKQLDRGMSHVRKRRIL